MNKDEIKSLRKQLKLTQVQFAKMLGVTSRAVQSWEAGRREPLPVNIVNLQNLQKIRNLNENDNKKIQGKT